MNIFVSGINSYLSSYIDGQDYFSIVSQDVVFSPNGQVINEVCFSVIIFDDTIAEIDENFSVGIASVVPSSGVIIGTRNIATITIGDNDGTTVLL